jgi:hypothetical protein
LQINSKSTASQSRPGGARDPQWWFVGASTIVTAIVLVLKYAFPSNALSAVADLVTVLLASYVSYAVSRFFATQSARSDLRDLAEATGEHIFLLSSQIRQLADESTDYQKEAARSQIYLETLRSQLYKLASQAELSFHNTQRLAGLDISIPALRDEVRTAFEEGTKTESVQCPRCKSPAEVVLSTNQGATRHAQCAKCKLPFMAHRLVDGKIRLTYEDSNRIDCPNSGCENSLIINRRGHEHGVVIRNCYECFARIRFNLDTRTVEGFDVEQPLEVPDGNIKDGHGPCPYCSYDVVFKGTRNSKGRMVQFCPNCTKLMLVSEPPAT